MVLSGADCPGEGEHKIAEHIRSSRERGRRHCIYGLDADLIMLALATHAPAIVILREKVVFRGKRGGASKAVSLRSTGEFVLLHSDLLRRYLDLELRTLLLPFEYSLDKILNDLLLLSFLVGNDFLPHSPALAIEEDGLDRLFGSYKRLLPRLGGYLLDGVDLVPHRLQKLLADVAAVELEFLKNDPHVQASTKRLKPTKAHAIAAEMDAAAAEAAAVRGVLGQPGAVAGSAAGPAAEGADGKKADDVTLPYEEKAAPAVHVPAAPPPVAPWAQAGGFSFAKVLKGEHLESLFAKMKGEAADAKQPKEPKAAKKGGRKKAKGGAKGKAADAEEDAAEEAEAEAEMPTTAPSLASSAGAMLRSILGVATPAEGAADAAGAVAPPPPEATSAPPAPTTEAIPPQANEAAGAEAAAAEADTVEAEFRRQALEPWSVADLEGLEEDSRDSMLGEKL